MCTNESPDQHCAEPRLSNLVSLGRHQMWDKSITESHHLVNPPSNQRQNPESTGVIASPKFKKAQNKASPGTVVPLTTGRMARKCLTKPLDLELVEHVDSFDCGVAAWIEPERDPCLIEKSISAEVKSIVQPRNRPTFKAISLKSCVGPMRSREYLLALTTQ